MDYISQMNSTGNNFVYVIILVLPVICGYEIIELIPNSFSRPVIILVTIVVLQIARFRKV